MSDVDTRRVMILGLIHSGTTAFWRAWREDGRFLCFDEPMSGLGVLPRQNSRRSYAEFIYVLKEDPRRFWDMYAPLHPIEELDREFTPRQRRYLEFICSRAPWVVADETHLHTHVRDLRRVFPRAFVIHLYRRASCFVTSHLRPGWSREAGGVRRLVRRLRDAHNKHVFWDRLDFVPGMRRDEVIGSHPDSKFGLLLQDAGYDAERIMSSPSAVRLLAYWHYHYHFLEREGGIAFGPRFRSLRYEDYAVNPCEVMAAMYDWVGVPRAAAGGYGFVYPPKEPFRGRSRRWTEAAKVAGFSDAEIADLL